MSSQLAAKQFVSERHAAAPVLRSVGKSKPSPSKKLKGVALARSFFGSLINPARLMTAARLHVNRRSHRHTFDDAQLALYAQVLPSDFLHFGYFDNIRQRPEDMSLSDVTRAQNRYAELLLELAGERGDPVLDVGCGMGGLSRMLLARGYSPVALTPDRLQGAHVRATMPNVPVLRYKLEQLPAAEQTARFGTIFTSESLQYLKLDQALPVLKALLKPGGKWVACDYFHTAPSTDKSCHVWDTFTSKLEAAGWRISYQRNITEHVLPTLGYIHMWASRFALPLMQFAFLRLRRKQPGIHHLLSGVEQLLQAAASGNVDLIDPTQFAASKKYMMLVMERA